jgi:hypothetical protein
MKNLTSWLWPDRVIGKRESRRLREEHNDLVNLFELAKLERVAAIEARELLNDYVVTGEGIKLFDAQANLPRLETNMAKNAYMNQEYLWRIEKLAENLELNLLNRPRRTVVIKRRRRGRVVFDRENQIRILGKWEKE